MKLCNYFKLILLSFFVACGLAICAPAATLARLPVYPMALKRLAVPDYPRFQDNGNVAPLKLSIKASLSYLRRLPPQRRMRFGKDLYSVSHLIRSLETFSGLVGESIGYQPNFDLLNATIRRDYRVYRSIGRKADGKVLFTGYYEPILSGRLTPGGEYRVPIHSRPRDLVEIDMKPSAPDFRDRRLVGRYAQGRVVPYPTRGEIRRDLDFNALAPPVGWLRDEIDLFILQIQGSGRLQLPNGEQRHILYDGSNGRPYRSIGSLLIAEGHISRAEMSMEAIRDYLQQNRKSASDLLDRNPRYIFFRQARYGPLGALGEILTPMRSVAVDRTIFPSAALSYIVTPLPRVRPPGVIVTWFTHTGFVLSQDAGSAIKGPGRVDLFMGHGRLAEVGAGRLKHTGALYFLVLKPDPAGNIDNAP